MPPDLTASVWRLPLVVIDTETTGLPDRGGRVCEIAAVRFEGGVPVATFGSFVNPGCPIPPEATAIHHITDADVAEAPTLPELAGRLLEVCAGAVTCAYNAPFDRAMLHAQVQGSDCHAFDPAESWVDVLVLVRHFQRYVSGQGRHKLTSVCARMGIVMGTAHRADADAIAAGLVLHRLKDKIGDVSAAHLIERCDVRRREQDEAFAVWRAQQTERRSP